MKIVFSTLLKIQTSINQFFIIDTEHYKSLGDFLLVYIHKENGILLILQMCNISHLKY